MTTYTDDSETVVVGANYHELWAAAARMVTAIHNEYDLVGEYALECLVTTNPVLVAAQELQALLR